MDLVSFIGSVVAGIVSSALTVILLERVRHARERTRFGALAGKYDHYTTTGERLLDGSTEIVHAGGNLLETHGSSTEGTWDGRIVMSRDLQDSGAGIYQYRGRADCGTHHIQVAPDRASCYVLTVNTSHGKNTTVAYVWRRATETP